MTVSTVEAAANVDDIWEISLEEAGPRPPKRRSSPAPVLEMGGVLGEAIEQNPRSGTMT